MNYDFYGIYASCRDAAWRCHIDYYIRSLPVHLKPIAKSSGIRIIKNSEVNELKKNEAGASLFVGGNWIIVYDDSLDITDARLVIAHELGHIFLGHEYKYSGERFLSEGDKLLSEREADMFALRLLAPACVLHELRVFSPEAIAELCCIPVSAAKRRAKRLAELEKRQCFYKSELEVKVAEGFKPYISEQKKTFVKSSVSNE